MKIKTTLLATAVLLFSLTTGLFMNTTYACTGIRLIAKDGSVVYGRTMEWGAFNLHTRIAVFPRGYAFSGLTPDGLNGKKWKAKYGIVGMDMIGQDYIAEGMNEAGLAVGLFYHNGFARYPAYSKKEADISLSAKDVVAYILGNFATIAEVKKGMSQVKVVPVVEKIIGIPVYAHWMVTSPSGKSIVIEFTDGKMKIYDDPLGVITNGPAFSWHMTNLRNYIKLSALPNQDKVMGGIKFAPIGAGSGMIGLPGDFTPPSRFIRAVMWTQTARPTPTSTETVYEVFRILDNFNVPLGQAEGSGISYPKGMRSSTEWTTAWDLSKRVLYYHTMNNRRVRALDLKKIDFSKIGKEIVHLPLDKTPNEDIEYLKL